MFLVIMHGQQIPQVWTRNTKTQESRKTIIIYFVIDKSEEYIVRSHTVQSTDSPGGILTEIKVVRVQWSRMCGSGRSKEWNFAEGSKTQVCQRTSLFVCS